MKIRDVIKGGDISIAQNTKNKLQPYGKIHLQNETIQTITEESFYTMSRRNEKDDEIVNTGPSPKYTELKMQRGKKNKQQFPKSPTRFEKP